MNDETQGQEWTGWVVGKAWNGTGHKKENILKIYFMNNATKTTKPMVLSFTNHMFVYVKLQKLC